MKLAVFTGKKPDQTRLHEVERAAALAAKHESDLLILPGHSFQNNCKPPLLDPEPSRIAQKYSIAILAELPYTGENNRADKKKNKATPATDTDLDLPWITYLFRPNGNIEGAWRQRFATSEQASNKPIAQLLVNDFANGNRVFRVAGKKVGFLYCGENNILKNSQKMGNQPDLRHKDLGWNTDYDILLNPAHTIMGNMGKLHRRFEWFSSGGRTFIFTTNNTSKTSWKSSFYMFSNGQKLMDGNAKSILKQENWQLFFIQVP